MSPRDAVNPATLGIDPASDPSSAITKSWCIPDSGEGSIHRLGNYEIVARLGQGGMGKVYKARHANLKRFFALKTLRTDVELSSEAIARFYREMEAIGRITHANVVQATDAGPVDGIDCLVMEYLDGNDLASVLRKVGRMSLPVACDLICQATEGLRAIGEHGLVHRDIKPSNLFLCTDGGLKILDLGLARLESNSDFSRRGEVYGTADYIAPEVAMGLGQYDIQADVYSLGCAFYKLLTGAAPFESDDHDSFASKLHAHVSEPPPPLRSHDAAIPAEIESLVARMLAKEPSDRPAVDEIVAALSPYISESARKEAAELARQHAAVAQSLLDHDVSTPVGHSPRDTRPDTSSDARRFQWQMIASVAAIALLLSGVSAAVIGSGIMSPGNDGEQESVVGEHAPTEVAAAAPETGIEVDTARIRELREHKRDDLTFWDVRDDGKSLFLHSNGSTLLGLKSIDSGDHQFAIEVTRLPSDKGTWGLIYGYQAEADGRIARYERLICNATQDGQHYLSRIVARIDTDSPHRPQELIAKVPVELEQRRNQLELHLRNHEPTEIRLNGKRLTELAGNAATPPRAEAAVLGVYCGDASATFSLPQLDGTFLELIESPSEP